MNRLKQSLLGAYYYASLPLRLWQGWHRSRRGRAPLSILFYHRIADSHPGDWTLSRQAFAAQVNWLRDRFDLISLAEVQERMRAGHNRRPAVAITFDDGYAENCEFALPLLLDRTIPFTYFVSLGHIESGKPFPHDIAVGQPLDPNTPEQIGRLSELGADIGAHTRWHVDLRRVSDRETLVDEIVRVREELQDLTGKPVRYFAFPYGRPENMSREACEVARQAGYAGVCSAYGGYNFPGENAFHLQRIHADPETIRLKNWLAVDPRKTGTRPPEFADEEDPGKAAGVEHPLPCGATGILQEALSSGNPTGDCGHGAFDETTVVGSTGRRD